MPIEVGDLFLSITASGATKAEGDLKKVDKAAAGVASTAVATEKRLAAVNVVAQKLAQSMREAFTAAAPTSGGFLGAFSKFGPAAIGVSLALGSVISGLNKLAEASDKAREAVNKLHGAALDTKIPFEVLKQRAEAVAVQYSLTTEETTQLIAAMAKLEQESHRAGTSQAVLEAALKTTQARGLTMAAGIDLITAAVGGNADAIRQLTGLKPDDLYDEYAKSVGKLGKDLNSTGRQQAVLNGMLKEGNRLTDDVKRSLDPLVESQRHSAKAWEDLSKAIGAALAPQRTWFNEAEAGFASYFANAIKAGRVWAAIIAIGKSAVMGQGVLAQEIVADALGAQAKDKFVGPKVPKGFVPPGLDKPSPDALKSDKATTAADHSTAEYLSTLKELVDEQRAIGEQIRTGIDLYTKEKAILDDSTQSMKRRAEAARTLRSAQFLKPFTDVLDPDKTITIPSLGRQQNVKDIAAEITELERLHKENALQVSDLTLGADLLEKEREAANATNLAWAEREKHMANVDRLSKALFLATPIDMKKPENTIPPEVQTSADDYWRDYYAAFVSAGYKQTDESNALLSQYFQKRDEELAEERTRSLADTIIAAFAALPQRIGDAVAQAFTVGARNGVAAGLSNLSQGLGDGFVSLGNFLASEGTKSILSGLGKFFKTVGIKVAAFGKLMSALQKAMTAHPLLAGAAAIAIGFAITRLGTGISGAANGGDSGSLGGGLGSLSTGATNAPQIYTFGQRPSSLSGTSTASAPRPQVNNFTIIGAGDPVAQREVSKMVANAARRGYDTGSGGRT